jgi:hypothetical protein
MLFQLVESEGASIIPVGAGICTKQKSAFAYRRGGFFVLKTLCKILG